MNQQPLQILRDWINTQGPGVCDDPRQVEAYLKDFCGQHKREIFVLVQAIREKVVADLRQGPTPPFTPEIFQARLAQRLHDNLGLSEDIARWTVAGWCEVLGIAVAIAANESHAAQATPASARIANRYERSADGEEVIDHQTGLIWRRAVEPGKFEWDEAQAHAKRIALRTGLPWRVPTIDELKTLIDEKRKKRNDRPVIDTDFFPERATEWFWSSSPYVGNAGYAGDVNFSNGVVGYSNRSSTSAVRLVRGG